MNTEKHNKLSGIRIITKMLKKYKVELDIIGNFFGIQPRFIISILGMESYYGKNQGKIKKVKLNLL